MKVNQFVFVIYYCLHIILCVLYIKQENFIYFGDYIRYYPKWEFLIKIFRNNIFEYFEYIKTGFCSENYNCLSVIIPSLFGVVFWNK